MIMRFGIVPKESPLISSSALRGTPNGSHDLTVGSLVPAGLNFPRGLLALNNCCPNGVILGFSAPPPESGTPAPDRGPAHVPLRSRLGAGPPVPTARSEG